MTSRPPASRKDRPRTPGPISLAALALMATVSVGTGCRDVRDPSLFPDSLLRAELGLTEADRVHRVALRGGASEGVMPDSVEVREGDWLEFVTDDWRVHEVHFESEGMGGTAWAFLEDSDQVASPPLVQLDARFVVSFLDAPEGRYPFRVEGNGASARGVVVVVPNR